MMNTKKTAAAILISVLAMAGCGTSKQNESSASPLSQQASSLTPQLPSSVSSAQEMVSALQIMNWKAEEADPALADIWKTVSPKEFVSGMTNDGIIFMAGLFASEEEAREAYETLKMEPSDRAFEQNEKTYQQETVNFTDDQGFMTIRQKNSWTAAIWYSTVEQQLPALAVLDLI